MVIDFFKAVITNFSSGDGHDIDWTMFVGTHNWTSALNNTLEQICDIIKNDPLRTDLGLSDFHPVKIVDVLGAKLVKYCQSKNSTPACTAIKLRANNNKLCGSDIVGLKLAARDLVAESVLNFDKIDKRDTVTQNIAITNLEARVRSLE